RCTIVTAGTGQNGNADAGERVRIRPDDTALSAVERLLPAARGRVRGTQQGKRRSGMFGASLEFADYRPYAPGDDIRRLDWNVYGRTGRAYIRQYWDEQELNATFYLDVSRSMRKDDGQTDASGAGNKLVHALQLAALVGYAALCGDDR